MRKRAVAPRRTAELQDVGFEFADVAAHADELFDVLPALFFQPFEVVVLRPCRNFEVAILAFKFLHPVAVFRIAPGCRFRMMRKLLIRSRRVARRRLLRPLLLYRATHTLLRDVVAPFVLIEKRLQSGDAMPVEPAPVDNARSVRDTPACSKSRATSRTVSVWFSVRSEAFRTVRKGSAAFGIVPKVAEAFGTFPKSSAGGLFMVFAVS